MPQYNTRLEILAPLDSENTQSAREDLIQSVRSMRKRITGRLSGKSRILLSLISASGADDFFHPARFSLLDNLIIVSTCRRLFGAHIIFFHDCSHVAFFPSRRANRILGYIAGIMTFTPFEDWQRTHVIHHSASGDLDRRGVGDIWTLTVDEYLSASRLKRFAYRFSVTPCCYLVSYPRFCF